MKILKKMEWLNQLRIRNRLQLKYNVCLAFGKKAATLKKKGRNSGVSSTSNLNFFILWQMFDYMCRRPKNQMETTKLNLLNGLNGLMPHRTSLACHSTRLIANELCKGEQVNITCLHKLLTQFWTLSSIYVGQGYRQPIYWTVAAPTRIQGNDNWILTSHICRDYPRLWQHPSPVKIRVGIDLQLPMFVVIGD